MARALIGLGSNLGDRLQTLDSAVIALGDRPRIEVLAVSRWIPTRAVGGPPDQGDFLNGALLVETSLEPRRLLGVLQELENAAGRQRAVRWDARSLDLDLLLYDDVQVESPELTLPHPAMAYRRFVLEPAAEVAGQMVHPLTGWTLDELLHHLKTAPNYIAVSGTPESGHRRLAAALAERHAMRLVVDPINAGALAQALADPTGLDPALAIELVTRRQQALAAADVPAAGNVWTLSDFWYHDGLVLGRALLSATGWSEFERNWEVALPRIPTPKLVIVLAAWRTAVADDLECALMALARRQGLGPVLQLEQGGNAGGGDQEGDFARQLADASAAVEAMQ